MCRQHERTNARTLHPQGPLFSQSTAVGVIRPMLQTRCPALLQLTIESADRYNTLEGPRGQPTFYKTGELQLARTPEELYGLQGILERSLALNVDGIEAASLVSPFEAALLHPLMNADTIIGGLYWGPDATLAPGRVCVDGSREEGDELRR